MERKKKRCKDCQKPSYLKGHGRCEWCYNRWYAENNKDKMLKRNRISNKTSKPKKPKKTKKQKLVEDIDRVFSLYVRLSESDDSGIVSCFTCDKSLSWKRGAIPGLESAQACHFISRGHMATRWYDLNVHAGCNECNVEKDGNMEVYEQKMLERYGEETVQKIYNAAHVGHQFSEVELSALYYKLKRDYDLLKKQKGL